MKSHIGLITQWYDPEVGAAAVPGVQARALRKFGHHVDVLTGFPNYPAGNVYGGYRVRPYQREVRDEIAVHRAPLVASHSTHALKRVANYMSFAAGATAVGLSRRTLGSVDVNLVHSTPATVALPAIAFRSIRRVPYVLHIQDLWPATVTSSGFLAERESVRVEKVLHRYCDVTYQRSSHIAVTSPGMADAIVRRGVPASKISFVPNWTDESCFRPVSRNTMLAAELGLDRRFTVMYAGNFGEFQDLHNVIRAAELLRNNREIALVLVGGGVAEHALRQMVSDLALDNVTFVPSQPFERMADILSLGDLHLLSLQDRPLFSITLPSKLQATLAAGKPMIATVHGDAERVIRESGAGLTVSPGDPAALAQAIQSLSDDEETIVRMGFAAREHYLSTFSEATSVRKLSEILDDAAKRGK